MMATETTRLFVLDASFSTVLNVGRAGAPFEKEILGTESETPVPLHTSCVILGQVTSPFGTSNLSFESWGL